MLDHLYAKFDKAHFAGLCKAIADGKSLTISKEIMASFKLECGRHGSGIPAAFFDRFFLWSFWSSSTLPRLVCLAYVRGFYFLFCCVEVSSVVLHCVVILYVVLRCVVSVLLRCVVLRSVVSLLCCIC